ncbi:alpha/beta hydrolase [Mycoplasmopsis bovis]|nr:alpha/beta hydrolase [Mycoplasmopsis bovis]QQH18954.1 alpha/beta hydrolase [Mycoplasmopsis bovis]QQH21220.1 alpha/beta hydrolase [Mycoplasmopsis bovis]QQH23800.1 alpha/beta hydrolase [Mycoplasmopsis bovis]QQH25923.1 alpha/beta hydrolase [Mycoplasmopsis bovis]QQH37001.1 alpha/beta hydrolase [Mycoplasmopsis bovis]
MSIIYKYDYVFKDNNNSEENIIFCHGFNSSPNSFKIFENYWTKSNYYALQFPGNNHTEIKEADDATVECYSDLLINFIEDNKLKNIILIGHSMGGGTISLAYQKKPELFKKLIYLAPTNKSSQNVTEAFLRDYFPKNFDEFIGFFKSLYYDVSKFTTNESWMRLVKNTFDPYDFNNSTITKLGQYLISNEFHDKLELALKSVNIPALLILGEDDGVVDRDLCLEYFKKENVKNVKALWMPKTGHMMFEEDWDNFIKIVEEFLNS